MAKNILTVVGITILIICIGLSGCFEGDKKQDDTNKFIGKWRLVERSIENYPYGMDNHTEETWIFYENKSLKMTSIHFMENPEEQNATININWVSFEVIEGRLYITTQDNSIIWHDYLFSNNDTQLTLSYPKNYTLKYNKIE